MLTLWTYFLMTGVIREPPLSTATTQNSLARELIEVVALRQCVCVCACVFGMKSLQTLVIWERHMRQNYAVISVSPHQATLN